MSAIAQFESKLFIMALLGFAPTSLEQLNANKESTNEMAQYILCQKKTVGKRNSSQKNERNICCLTNRRESQK